MYDTWMYDGEESYLIISVCYWTRDSSHDISFDIKYVHKEVGWEKDYVVMLFGFNIIYSRA